MSQMLLFLLFMCSQCSVLASWSHTFHHGYASLFSALINSSLSLNHHLYADDIHFLSFYPPDKRITYLMNALQHISSWMTANLLTLRTSKTEFLLIGLKQHWDKMRNCTLNTTHSARNLRFIFNGHLTFSDQTCALSKSCFSHILELRCIHPILIFK